MDVGFPGRSDRVLGTKPVSSASAAQSQLSRYDLPHAQGPSCLTIIPLEAMPQFPLWTL